MKLVFGLGTDGRTFPDIVGATGDVAGGVVGPQALVSLIEAQLGLSRPVVSRPARIAAWLTKLRAAGAASVGGTCNELWLHMPVVGALVRRPRGWPYVTSARGREGSSSILNRRNT